MSQLVEFATKHALLVAGLVAALVAVLVFEIRQRALGVTHVSTAAAVRLINKGALVIDVRKADAFASGHIVNARNIALDTLSTDDDAVGKQKSKVLLTVCDDGASAGKAASRLRKTGYDHAFSLKGGLRDWRQDNLPIVK